MALKIEPRPTVGGASVPFELVRSVCFSPARKKDRQGDPFRSLVLIRDNLFGCCISFANGVPVNHIEERGDVVWTFVLIVEVVGVLPNVQA